jgi:hypothetical protein
MQRFFGNKSQDVQAEEELVSLVGGRRASDSAQRPSSSRDTVLLTLSIKGMHCSSCSSAIENALKYVNNDSNFLEQRLLYLRDAA